MVGRKYTFLVTIMLMGLSTFVVALLPSSATIGILAPIILIILRLLQGLALGGEYGGAATYVAEHSPHGRRGFYTSWIQTTATLGLFLSLVVILGTRTLVGEANFAAWGWRIPFAVSIVLLGISFAMIDQCVRWPVLEGPLFVVGGLVVGLGLFLPLYLLRAMGAGDVKLLAMVGAFLGPADTFRVALATMIVGGVMAIIFVVVNGTIGLMTRNLRSLFQLGLLDVLGGRAPDLQVTPSLSAGRLPYGVAISTGTMGYLVARQLGFT
jgi:MFS family permease